MKSILASSGNRVAVVVPVVRMMRALTNGGFGQLPGDVVTADLTESEARRVEVAREMPFGRAVENMVRGGCEAGFATRWCRAVVDGGETDATALGMILTKDVPEAAKGDVAAVAAEVVPADRTYRDAWRKKRDGIVIDMDAARLIFAQRVIDAKGAKIVALNRDTSIAMTAGRPTEALEKVYADLVALDLRKLGGQVMKAASVEELNGLWPALLKDEPRE